jgi:fructosamine-3-kinase
MVGQRDVDTAGRRAHRPRDRVLLHQVHPLLLHAVLFGGSYAAQVVRAARRYA